MSGANIKAFYLFQWQMEVNIKMVNIPRLTVKLIDTENYVCQKHKFDEL